MSQLICKSKRYALGSLLLGLLWHSVSSAQPMDLLDTWRLAQGNDPEYQAEQAAVEAGTEQRSQARSLWLPNIGATATAGRAGRTSSVEGAQFIMPGTLDNPAGMTSKDVEFNTSVRGGDLYSYGLGIKQPILDRARLAQSRQLRLTAEVAELKWQAAQQSLLLKVAQRYFAVLLAREKVSLLTDQKNQVDLVHKESQARFALGDRPVTDTYETLAHAQGLQAQLLAAQMQAELAAADFTDLTTQTPQHLLSLPLQTPVQAPHLDPLADWLTEVVQLNPMLQMHAKGVTIAAEQVAQYSSWSSPTLDLLGHVGYEKLDGSGRYGSALNKADEWMVGVQFNVPIFTGGYRSSKHREALHLQEQNLAQGEVLRQQIQQQTRAAWLGIQVNGQQISALQQGVKASQERLAATRLGHELGDNTTLERLDAENAVAQMQLELLDAKVSLIIHQMQLAALVGGLDEQHLLQANGYLQKP